jgi:endonuclease-3 related protein
VLVGAVLTQNTSWRNVEKALANLKREGLMEPVALYAAPKERLAELIRPAGYYNVKAARLRNLLKAVVEEYGGSLERFFEGSVTDLRERLLAISGVGRETADSIVLYAAGKPAFVVDTYTSRVLYRHGLIFEDATYEDVKAVFEDGLEEDAALFNEYHALIVEVAKAYCRKAAPRCGECPLNKWPHSEE